MKKRIDWGRLYPVTVSMQGEWSFILGGWIVSGMISLTFLLNYFDQWSGLFGMDPATGERWIQDMAMMPRFFELIGPHLFGFQVLPIMLMGLAVYHYLSHSIGSRAMYTMKRLPDRFELHRRCLTIPILAILANVLLAAILCGLYMLLYYFVTPDVCIPQYWYLPQVY